ncbi:uncharacterized protein LOC106872177 [Octopus bimaculoides]|uniref:uncharacterized protein LOC106872177 n=1 Tax=Octopus bimaculoides TaxID=37653 RepID=UPI00071DACFA|nr:uncharacterized protein LOC106872177 [Octopus bimaculoides]|eukprot:XP_014774554.1 PREDICTED: uncharacterized protein LOC106872177 [Octopus bimaculoides]
MASYTATSRTTEGPEKTATRLATNAAATAASRASEGQQKTANRLTKNPAVTAASRASESQQQTANRLTKNAAATAASRSSKRLEQRATRLATNAAAITASMAYEDAGGHSITIANVASATATAPSHDQRPTLQQNSRRRHPAYSVTTPNSHYWHLRAFNYEPNFHYSSRADINIGEMCSNCQFCNAKMWAAEPPGMCCLNGKVRLPPLPQPPQPLKELLTGSTSSSSKFLQIIRNYNYAFQMTSFGANVVTDSGWMPTFKVQGQVYHLIGSLHPLPNCKPSFLQIYFISNYNRQLDVRFGIIPPPANTGADTFDRDVMLSLQNMLHQHNSYIRSFKYALQTAPSPKFTIVIDADKRPSGEHAQRYNAPSCNDVAVLLHGEQHNNRVIVIHSRDRGLQRITETHRSYDALQYPILFPYGEGGYHFGIPQRKPNEPTAATSKTASCMDFYSYRFMTRPNDFSTLHRSRELFHQFAVDMAAKMESERLCFIRLNQKKLRSDSYIHLRDGINNDADPRNISKICILPSTYTGEPRYMHERRQDDMTFVRHYGRPDLFITFTSKHYEAISAHTSLSKALKTTEAYNGEVVLNNAFGIAETTQFESLE